MNSIKESIINTLKAMKRRPGMYLAPAKQNFHTIDMLMYGIQIGNEMHIQRDRSDTYPHYVQRKLRLPSQSPPSNDDLDYNMSIDLAIEWVKQSDIMTAKARAMDDALG
ncbi:MAG: hypothetical protein ACXQTI_07395 [Candidatus Nezhaarchaeales archaeon]